MILYVEPISSFLVPGDSPSSLQDSGIKHDEIEVRWKACALWNGPQIGFEIKACSKNKGEIQEKYKPILYDLSSFHKVCLNFVGAM